MCNEKENDEKHILDISNKMHDSFCKKMNCACIEILETGKYRCGFGIYDGKTWSSMSELDKLFRTTPIPDNCPYWKLGGKIDKIFPRLLLKYNYVMFGKRYIRCHDLVPTIEELKAKNLVK